MACGDGIVIGAEQCDDENSTSGDGCSSECQIEPGYECEGEPSQCTQFTVLRVSASATGQPIDGSSWSQAFRDLQAAIDFAANITQGTANARVELWLKEGTYSAASSPEGTFLLKDEISLIGGFRGTETEASQRGNPFVVSTLLDGQDAAPILTAEDIGDVALTGLVIDGGRGINGGGLHAMDTGLFTIRQCLFSSNFATGDGGAIWLQHAAASVYDSYFVWNSTSGKGGAVNVAWGGFHAENCVFGGNTANWGGGFRGDLTANDSGYFTNCTFWGNSATYGDAIQASYTYMNNCIVWGHNSTNPIFSSVTGSNNVCEDDDCGDDSINANPRFTDPDNLDFTINAGSPCIDAANSSAPDYDIRMQPRVDDPATPNGDSIADIGAYEYRP